MSNPFDAATPALIECYESNVAYYSSGAAKPNYPMPAISRDVVIMPCAVFVYDASDPMIERITYLAFNYIRTGHPIWG